MPRNSGVTIQSNFIGGLITESTPLKFPENASTDTKNCVFDFTGKVSRRPEIDLENEYVINTAVSFSIKEAYTEFIWTQVSSGGQNAFFVQQQGKTLRFYDISSNTVVSNGALADTIDLSDYLAEDSLLEVARVPCQYAQGNSSLIVVSRAINPIVIKFDPMSNTFDITEQTLKYRDFIGLEDPYGDTTRPTFASITAMRGDSNGAIHYYNLLNQGWGNSGTIDEGGPSSTSPLGQWDNESTTGSPAIGVMPSNCDQVAFYRGSETDSFDNDRLVQFGQGNTLAPKGHYILEVGNVNRRQAVVDEGYDFDLDGEGPSLIAHDTGTVIHTAQGGKYSNVSGTTLAFDNNFDSTSYASIVVQEGPTNPNAFFGKDWGSGNAKKIDRAIYYCAQSPTSSNYLAAWRAKHNDVAAELTLRASNTAPSTTGGVQSGTVLGTVTVNPSQSISQVTIMSSDQDTAYRYVWIQIRWLGKVPDNRPVAFYWPEVQFFEHVTFDGTADFIEPDKTSERPQCVAFFAGRAFYGGIQDDDTGNNIYFTQIIENDTQYSRCYQVNDPTSEVSFNLLASDGGVIKIPEMGKLIKLFAYQTALVCIATNGVWLVRGSSGSGFLATDYVVRKLTSFGSQSPYSVVDVEGIPYWWGESGIYVLEYNPQFDSFSVASITDETIRSFYLDIPANYRKFTKGCYDPNEKFIYWLYNRAEVDRTTGNDDDDGQTDHILDDSMWSYDSILVYNTRTKAFFPWEVVHNTNTDGPIIKGISYVEDVIGISNPEVKITFVVDQGDNTELLQFASIEHTDPKYIDWYQYANDVLDPADDTYECDYISYFVTGYEIDGELMKYVQPNYIQLFLDQPYDADGNRIEQSAYLKGVFDFAISGDTGAWSSTAQSSQQIFNANLPNRSLNWRRLKIRGKGKCLQFRVSSESGKPFGIVGWSVFKTSNTSV